MRRRHFGAILLAAGASLAATAPESKDSIQGKLIQRAGKPAVLQTGNGQEISLSGDEDTEKVLHDSRLSGMTVQAIGHFTAPGRFSVEPIYEKNLFVLRDGKPLRITYWCDICSIRTYAPGNCMCCQKWTDLDLRDPNQE